jgi:peptidyl-tRNA hydrolase, PTH2 family
MSETNYKQVIVIRKDLGMTKGKMIAQGSHASLSAYLSAPSKIRNDWINEGMTKICVYVNSEKELLDIYNRCKTDKVNVALITDNGTTQFHGVLTNTCICLGPCKKEILDKYTGSLKLL